MELEQWCVNTRELLMSEEENSKAVEQARLDCAVGNRPTAIPPTSFANVELITAIRGMLTGKESLNRLVQHAIESAAPRLKDHEKLRIATFLASKYRYGPKAVVATVGLAEIADIRLLTVNTELAMEVFERPVTMERLSIIRVIITLYLNMHNDFEFDVDLSEYISKASDEKLRELMRAMKLMVTACKDYESDPSMSGLSTHPALTLLTPSIRWFDIDHFVARVNWVLPDMMLHRAGRVFETVRQDGLIIVESPIARFARLISLRDSIYRAPWVGKALTNMLHITCRGDISQEFFAWPDMIFRAYYGVLDLVHNRNFEQIEAGFENYMVELRAFFYAVAHLDNPDRQRDYWLVKTEFTTSVMLLGIVRDTTKNPDMSIVEQLEEALALLRTATHQLAMRSEI